MIYAVRIRHFRVAFIQLLSRKPNVQAEELERNMFGLGGTGVHDNLVVKQGNQTLNDKHEPPMQEEPRSECKKNSSDKENLRQKGLEDAKDTPNYE